MFICDSETEDGTADDTVEVTGVSAPPPQKKGGSFGGRKRDYGKNNYQLNTAIT